MASAWAAGPPKVAPTAASAASAASSGDWPLGAAVKLTTTDGETLSGEARGTQRSAARSRRRSRRAGWRAQTADAHRPTHVARPQVFACERALEVLVLKAPAATPGESVLRIVALKSIKARRRGGARGGVHPRQLRWP